MAASRSASASQNRSYDAIFQKHARDYNIDWRLLKAIAMQESSLNPRAVNKADPSYGLMQVLCTENDGDPFCDNVFNLPGWGKVTKEKLLDPDTNIAYGAQIFAWNLRTYGSVEKALAVYNSWDQRNAPQRGPFKNQHYVDGVLGYFRELGGVL